MWPARRTTGIGKPEPPTPRFPVVEENLRGMMRFFSQAHRLGVVEQRPGLQLVSSGLDFGPFNSAMLSRPIAGMTSGAFESQVAAAAEFFRARKERWSFWLCNDLLSEPVLRRAPGILISHRLRRSSEPPGMLLDNLLPPTRPLPNDLHVLPVRDRATRLDFAAMTSTAFDVPYSVCRAAYAGDTVWDGPLQAWAGYLHGRPIVTCAAIVTGDVVGLYTIGTMPEFRNKGYSESLVRAVLAGVAKERGVTRSVLQATPAGYPMYHKMGYRKIAQFSIFLSEY